MLSDGTNNAKINSSVCFLFRFIWLDFKTYFANWTFNNRRIESIMTDYKLNIDVDNSESLAAFRLNSDRRIGGDRRAFSYSLHIPERRNGKDRRCGRDRRKMPRIRIRG